jgi:hypothetical protein
LSRSSITKSGILHLCSRLVSGSTREFWILTRRRPAGLWRGKHFGFWIGAMASDSNLESGKRGIDSASEKAARSSSI